MAPRAAETRKEKKKTLNSFFKIIIVIIIICRFNLVKFQSICTCEQERVHGNKGPTLHPEGKKLFSYLFEFKKKKKVTGRYIMLLHLMGAFIKRRGLRRNEKGGGEAERVTFQRVSQIKKKKEWMRKKTKRGSRYRIPFLLVRQINKREMMKEKEEEEEKKRSGWDIYEMMMAMMMMATGGLSAFWLLYIPWDAHHPSSKRRSPFIRSFFIIIIFFFLIHPQQPAKMNWEWKGDAGELPFLLFLLRPQIQMRAEGHWLTERSFILGA